LKLYLSQKSPRNHILVRSLAECNGTSGLLVSSVYIFRHLFSVNFILIYLLRGFYSLFANCLIVSSSG